MWFRNKENSFYKNISTKTKIIIFIILTFVVVIIAYKEAINNRNINKKNTNVVENIDKKNENDSKEMKAKKAEEEKIKKLEQKYDESFKAFGEKRYDDTITLANIVIEEDTNFYKAYNIKGIALCYKNNFDEGMKNIDKALQLKSDFGYARFNKALAYELHGDYDESLNWYDKNLQVENYIWSYYGKASIYGRRGDIENTVKYLKIAIDMSSDIKKIAAEEEDFNPVRDSKEFEELIK